MIEPPATPRRLTAEERSFLARSGFDAGFDDDDEDKHQYRHVCWPGDSRLGPLCGSSRLWFYATFKDWPEHEEIDCPECLRLLKVYMGGGPLVDSVLIAMGRLSSRLSYTRVVEHTVTDYLTVLDDPERYSRHTTPGDKLKEVREAMEVSFQHYLTLLRKPVKEGGTDGP